MKPSRGTLVLVFGIVGFTCIPLSVAAWIMGSEDLKDMDAGTMDDTDRSITNAGRILGMIGVLLPVVAALLGLLILASMMPARPYSRPDHSQVYKVGQWAYTLCTSNNATITEYLGHSDSVAIPSTVGAFGIVPSWLFGHPVTGIGRGAFFARSNLTSVVIPGSVTNIGVPFYPEGKPGVFEMCVGLTNVVLGEGIVRIDSGTFSGCAQLAEISLPESIRYIGDNAFGNCVRLASVRIPDGVMSIRDGTFSGCTALTNVTIGFGVTQIGGSAFRNCTALAHIAIPDAVTAIRERAFKGCRGLESVELGKGIVTIGAGAFSDCTSLTSMVIPASVTDIGLGAFSDCANLSNVSIPAHFRESEGKFARNTSPLTEIGLTEPLAAKLSLQMLEEREYALPPTPIAQYRRRAVSAIGASYKALIEGRVDLFTVGSLNAVARIDAAGRVVHAQVVSNTSSESFEVVSTQAILTAHVPPIPLDVLASLPEGLVDVPVSFGITSE